MGLLDLLQKGGPAAGGFIGTALQAIEGNGGLDGILARLKDGGLAREAASWVGTGENLPVTAAQIQSVFGSRGVQELAARMGVDPNQVASGLAQVLPTVIDHFTPHGTVPDASAQGAAMAALKARLGV